MTGKPCGSCGTFNNVVIDGRLSLSSAIEVARNHLKKENNYNGFAIEKLCRAWDYKNPLIIDNDAKAKDIDHLIRG